MKKILYGFICLLFVLNILFPAGVAIAACFGYDFELTSVPAFAVTIAAVSVLAVISALPLKITVDNKLIGAILAFLTPLSLINAVFYIAQCSRVLEIVAAFISPCCCCLLTLRYGRPMELKSVSLIGSALMLLPIGFFGFISFLFSNFGQNTVVHTIESPSGNYYAQVIDSDQGALGGNTFVDVNEKSGINMILFRIEKKPQRVYIGDWGEFEDMQIHWKDDGCLVIDSVEYKIE